MTYTELSMASAGWGFELGSIAMDIVNNQRCFLKGRAREKAMAEKVSDREIEQIMFWAKKKGVDLKFSLDIAFASIAAQRYSAAREPNQQEQRREP